MSHLVDPKLAEECIAQYQQMYTTNDIDAILKAYSESISFSYVSVNKLITEAADLTDTLEIQLGVYTQAFCDAYPQAQPNLGRLTAFLGTKRSGGGVGDPPNNLLNLGEMKP